MRLLEFYDNLNEVSSGYPSDVTGWVHLKTGKNIYKDRNIYHYELIKEFWREMGLDERTAMFAKDEYFGNAQMAAYANGWLRWFYDRGGDEFNISGPKHLLKGSLPIIIKIIRNLQPAKVVVDQLDKGGGVGHGGEFDAHDTRGIRGFLQGQQTESILESMLLFELRNVFNTDAVKQWARMQAQFLYQLFERDPEVAKAVDEWAQRALVKYAIEEMPSSNVQVIPTDDPNAEPMVYDGKQNHKYNSLPPWAQQAIQRNDLVVVEPWKHTLRSDSPIGGSIRNQVADWLRYMYQQDPGSLTMQRLGHYSWMDAVQATHDYHAKLTAEQERIAIPIDAAIWYEENKETFPKRADEETENRITTMVRTLRGDKGYPDAFGFSRAGLEHIKIAEFKGIVGSAAIPIIRAFEKATGKKVELPEDDPTGIEPYLRYDQKDDKIEHDDFQPAPEIGDQWVKLHTTKCAEYEGTMMGNCVGGYGREVEQGSTWIYSFRDKNNEPHITIEVTPQGDTVDLDQIKGKRNEPPVAKYHGKVIDFLKKLGTKYVIETTDESDGDLISMGMFPDHSQKALTIKMLQPPLDMNNFTKYTVAQESPEEPEDEDDEPEYPEDEVTDEEHGNLYELLDGAGLDDHVVSIINHIMDGQYCWYDEWEHTFDGSSTQTQICYSGEDKYNRDRRWVTVL